MDIDCLAVIPARFSSSRLPGKPLKEIGGKTLIQRVWERASQAKCFSRIIVASDDQRILEHARQFGAEAMTTGSSCLTGSDRVAEVAERLQGQGQAPSLIANVQGDMPFINPRVIESTVEVLRGAPATVGMSTVATPILDQDEFTRNSTVKVALGTDNRALYFSRSPIPCWRDKAVDFEATQENPFGFRHMGLYVFRPPVLAEMARHKQTFTEIREGLEQLRALANGVEIRVHIARREDLVDQIEVDTPDDLAHAIEIAAR